MPSYFLKSVEWTSAENEIDVTLYQPNLTLEDKWSQYGIIKSQGMMEKAIEDASEGDLIVFPETALILSENDNKTFMNLVRSKSFEKNITLITGIIEREDDYKIRTVSYTHLTLPTKA